MTWCGNRRTSTGLRRRFASCSMGGDVPTYRHSESPGCGWDRGPARVFSRRVDCRDDGTLLGAPPVADCLRVRKRRRVPHFHHSDSCDWGVVSRSRKGVSARELRRPGGECFGSAWSGNRRSHVEGTDRRRNQRAAHVLHARDCNSIDGWFWVVHWTFGSVRRPFRSVVSVSCRAVARISFGPGDLLVTGGSG